MKKTYLILIIPVLIVGIFIINYFKIANVQGTSDLNVGDILDTQLYGIMKMKADLTSSKEDKALLRDFAIETTKDCKTDKCKARKLYDILVDEWNYERGMDINPVNIFKEKSGDCDEMSILYIDLLEKLDIDAIIKCTPTHCWNVVKLEDKALHVDIVQFVFKELE